MGVDNIRIFSDTEELPLFKAFRIYVVDLLSTPMGVDYVVIGFDMEVQPLVTHNAA